ncbi:MAG: 3-isopropylmalate dehydratase small subunit, partial [Marinobacter alexandrii]
AKTVTTPAGEAFDFEVDDFRRHCLLNGLDDIGVTLEQAEVIKAYEEQRRQTAPWLFGAGN